MKHRFVLELPQRRVIAEVEEEEKRVVVSLWYSVCGDFGDTKELSDWFYPIVSRYDSDPRPLVMKNTTGEVVTVFGDAESSVVVVGEVVP